MVKVRVELVSDIGAKKGIVASGVVVESDYASVLKAVQNKFQLRKKDLAGLVLSVKNFSGTRVLPKGDLGALLDNGDLVHVSMGCAANELLAALPGERERSGKKLNKLVEKGLKQLRWVPVGRGHLAARGCPNLETLAALHSTGGATGLVTLLRDDERDYAARHLGDACRRIDIRWCHAPLNGVASLRKLELPPEDRASFRTVLDVRDWILTGEEKVIVHCAAGLHRTGMYLYCLLRLLGECPDGALAKLRDIRQESFSEFLRLGFQRQAEQVVAELSGVERVDPVDDITELDIPAHEHDPDDDETYVVDEDDEKTP